MGGSEDEAEKLVYSIQKEIDLSLNPSPWREGLYKYSYFC
jgi:hypothetical protein